MFTGLIEDTGRVVGFDRSGRAGLLRVKSSLPLDEIAIGDSVAVNGACLTVTRKLDGVLTFDVSPESLSATTLGSLISGSMVNLERALRLGDRMGGHIVTGHVDCIGHLARMVETSQHHVLEFTLPSESARYLVAKGSVTINGISLTVNTVTQKGFSVTIIPHTLEHTTLHTLRPGDQVNIETDIIGKYVERLTQPWKGSSGLTMKSLAENGFL